MPSTSASYVIVGLAVFIAFATLWSAGADTTERVSGSLEDQREQTHRLLDTRIEITSATHNDSTLNVTVENTGSTRLALGRTDLLVDGRYHQAEELNTSATATTVLHIGERMEFNLTVDDPAIVTVVTEQGVADTARVTNDTGDTPPPSPGPAPFTLKDDVAFVQYKLSATIGPARQPLASVLNGTDVERGYGGNVSSIGPVVENFTQTNLNEIPSINRTNGSVVVRAADGSSTVLATDGTTDRSRLAAGTWNGSSPSVLYANASDELRRVTSRGLVVDVSTSYGGAWVAPVRVEAVSGIADVDGDGSDELVHGGNGTAGKADYINYVDDDGTVYEMGGSYGLPSGSASAIGLGEPADFDGDGVACVPWVNVTKYTVSGNNVQYEAHIELAGSSAASGKCSIGSFSGGASKAPTPDSVPMASTDVDADGQPEIVYVNYTSNTLKYVDSVRNNNQVRVVTNSSGVTVDGRWAG